MTDLQPLPTSAPPLDGVPNLQSEPWLSWFTNLRLYVRRTQIRKTFADTGYVAAPQQLVLVDATAGATTIKLPADPVNGLVVTVKKVDASGNAVTIDGNTKTIDGAATQALAAQWNFKTLQGNGAAYFIVAVG